MADSDILNLTVKMIIGLEDRMPLCKELGLNGGDAASYLERTVGAHFQDGANGFSNADLHLERARHAAIIGLPHYLSQIRSVEICYQIASAAVPAVMGAALAYFTLTNLSGGYEQSFNPDMAVVAVVKGLTSIAAMVLVSTALVQKVKTGFVSAAVRRYGHSIIRAYNQPADL